MDLSFGEQVKVLLKRQNMTIKDLAAILEKQTGKPTSRQNLTQKLGRNNFQEQDMHEIARALNCGLFIQLVPRSELHPITPVAPIPVTAIPDASLPSVEAILAAAQIQNIPAEPAESTKKTPVEPAAAIPIPASEADQAAVPVHDAEQADAPVHETERAAAPVYKTEQADAPIYETERADAPVYKTERAAAPVHETNQAAAPVHDAEQEELSYYIEKKDPDKEALTQQLSALLNPLMHSERKKRPERNSSRFPFFHEPIRDTAEAETAGTDNSESGKADRTDSLESGKADSSQAAEPEINQPAAAGLPDSINPLTGEEYLNNTVRPCPNHPGYIEVYDRSEHTWVETNESEFLRFQQQKRAMLGADYEPPIYI